MLTNPLDIQNAENALKKCSDAKEKLCEVRTSATITEADKATTIQVIDQISALMQHFSGIIPPF